MPLPWSASVRKPFAFDEKKLEWMNGQHLHKCDNAFLATFLRQGLMDAGIDVTSETDVRMAQIAGMLKTRIHFLRELPEMARYFFVAPTSYDEKAKSKAWGIGSRSVVSILRARLQTLEFYDAAHIEKLFTDVALELNLKLGSLVHPVRLAVSGVSGGPGLWELLEAIEQGEVVRRLVVAEELMQP